VAIPAKICYKYKMPIGRRISCAFPAFASALAVALLSTGMALAAESTGAATKKSLPAQLDRKSRELSPSALGMETDKSHGYEPGDDKSDTKRPGEFKFGDNTLHIDANKNDPIPPVGLESNGQAVINKAPTEPVLQPSYFGFRLTTPIR
jgi:hypothetical protein